MGSRDETPKSPTILRIANSVLFYTREVPENTMKDRRLEEKFCYFKSRLTYRN